MALFSRRKPTDDDAIEVTQETAAPKPEDAVTAAAADALVEEVEVIPEVGISVSAFGGLGAPAQPAPKPVRPADDGAAIALPFAPSEPPSQWETIDGLRDNAVLRDALARLPEKPSGPELLGVARQVLQGHLFLRVKGDAKEQLEQGKPLALGVVRDGDRNFVLAFSSGGALRDAVKADNDTATSAVGQPSQTVLQHVLDGEFAGLILDNATPKARAVLPRDLLQRALDQADPQFRIKSLISGERTDQTVAEVVAALAEVGTFVAIAKTKDADGNEAFGVAEVRTPDGTRLLQLFTHPLEVVALAREEQPAPFTPDQLRAALRGSEGIDGVLIDAAGPLLQVRRDQLAPLLQD